MDKDRMEGKLNDVKGRVERQAGEWTGDKESQAKGAGDQLKGKAQNAFGNAKDAGRDMVDKADRKLHEDGSMDRDRDRDRKSA